MTTQICDKTKVFETKEPLHIIVNFWVERYSNLGKNLHGQSK
jgi:hypothetical protein